MWISWCVNGTGLWNKEFVTKVIISKLQTLVLLLYALFVAVSYGGTDTEKILFLHNRKTSTHSKTYITSLLVSHFTI
jgi:hypothetical protein